MSESSNFIGFNLFIFSNLLTRPFVKYGFVPVNISFFDFKVSAIFKARDSSIDSSNNPRNFTDSRKTVISFNVEFK